MGEMIAFLEAGSVFVEVFDKDLGAWVSPML